MIMLLTGLYWFFDKYLSCVKTIVQLFSGWFHHDVAKYFYKWVIRIIYLSWAFFTFIIGYRVFVAGSLQLKSSDEITPIEITGKLAANMVITFWILIGLGVIWAIVKTWQYYRDWVTGKREVTLRNLANTIVVIDSRLNEIEKKLGIVGKQGHISLIGQDKTIGEPNKETREHLKKIRMKKE